MKKLLPLLTVLLCTVGMYAQPLASRTVSSTTTIIKTESKTNAVEMSDPAKKNRKNAVAKKSATSANRKIKIENVKTSTKSTVKTTKTTVKVSEKGNQNPGTEKKRETYYINETGAKVYVRE